MASGRKHNDLQTSTAGRRRWSCWYCFAAVPSSVKSMAVDAVSDIGREPMGRRSRLARSSTLPSDVAVGRAARPERGTFDPVREALGHGL